MLFSSITFLYYFLPFVLAVYFLLPNKMKNGALLLVSLVFYAWGEPKYVFLMMGLIVFNFGMGILLEKVEYLPEQSAAAWGRRKRYLKKMILAAAVAISLGVLCFFKFSDVAWPIGISFYTFQLISYIVDVYRQEAKAQRNLCDLGAYVAMFPQLIAGPIVRYADIAEQLKRRVHSFENTALGMRRFLVGLGKKILISNALGELCMIFRNSDDKSVLFFWVYAVSYTLQIYFDFSGYSDMAIGLGRIFGFTFLENFNYPYISKSITEFWRRWHMSLGTWFRDYVYIPLGGNRVPKIRWYFNILVVWALTGLWHGGAVHFVVWGLMFAVLLVFEKMWLLQKLEKARIWNHIYVLFWIIISFVIFNAADMGEAVSYIGAMFGIGDVPFVSAECIYYLKSYGVLLIAAAVGATPIVKNAVVKVGQWLTVSDESSKKRAAVMSLTGAIGQTLGMLVLLLVCTAYLIDGSFNPFLYFRF